MKNSAMIFLLLGMVFAALTSISAQDSFTSADGSFTIGIPEAGVTVTDKSIDEAGMVGSGKSYGWLKQGEYFYQVGYYKMEKTPLTPEQKTNLLASFRVGIVDEAKKDNSPVSETPYAFQGNKGAEIKVSFPSGKMIIRFFATDTQFFYIEIALKSASPESDAERILDSFRLLGAAGPKTVKIK